jgi:outer membrane protein assembly factor BamB
MLMTESPRFVSLAFFSFAFACAERHDPPPQDSEADATTADTSSTSSADTSSSSDGGDTFGDDSSSSGASDEPAQAEELWRQDLGTGFASAVIGTPDGGAVVVGTDDPFEGRALAVRVDGDGEVLWTRTLAPVGEHAEFSDVAIAADGAVWVAGYRGWESSISFSRSMVVERLDDATGDVLWEEPGIDLDGLVSPSHDLFAILAVEDGVLVAGQESDADGVAHPLVRRYAGDGTVLWSGWPAEEGRAHDLARIGDNVLAVGMLFEYGDESEPIEAWATMLDLDGQYVATPEVPGGSGDLVLALSLPEHGALALGQRYVEDDHGFDDEIGWMLPLGFTGNAGTPMQLPGDLGGAVVRPTDELVPGGELTPSGELVVAYGENVAAYDFEGTRIWELEDTPSISTNYSDAVALAADGNVFVAGGFEELQLAKIAAPMR